MPLTKERYHGKVLNWAWRGHGFVYDYKKKCKVFVHFTDINEKGYISLRRGDKLSYRLTYNTAKKTWVAKNVKYEEKR